MKASVQRPLDRRSFFKSAGTAATGAAAIGFLGDAELEGAVQNVNTRSIPSQLKITDLRVVPILGQFRSYVVRLDTNQGISGYGEIRRVLKLSGRFAIYDVVLNSGDPHYPVPWARTPATS